MKMTMAVVAGMEMVARMLAATKRQQQQQNYGIDNGSNRDGDDGRDDDCNRDDVGNGDKGGGNRDDRDKKFEDDNGSDGDMMVTEIVATMLAASKRQ